MESKMSEEGSQASHYFVTQHKVVIIVYADRNDFVVLLL